MNAYKVTLINEFYKILKKKKVIVAALLFLGTVVLGQFIVLSLRNFAGIRVTGTSSFPLFILSVLGATLVPLFGTFVAIDMFSGEFANNTIKLAITRPVTRFKIFAAKVSAVALFVLANLLYIMVLSVVSSLIFAGGVDNLWRVPVAYVAALLPIMAFIMLVVFLSNIFKSSGVVFMISIVVYLALVVLSIIYSRYSSFFITSMFDWYNLVIASHVNFGKLLRIMLILFGFGGTFFGAGCLLFERRRF